MSSKRKFINNLIIVKKTNYNFLIINSNYLTK